MFFILTSGEPSVNKIDLQALNLAGPTATRLVPDPLAVLGLENQLYITKMNEITLIFHDLVVVVVDPIWKVASWHALAASTITKTPKWKS